MNDNIADKALAFITSQLSAGRTVDISTAMRTTRISPSIYKKWQARGLELFKLSPDGLRMAYGKRYDLIVTPSQSLVRIAAV